MAAQTGLDRFLGSSGGDDGGSSAAAPAETQSAETGGETSAEPAQAETNEGGQSQAATQPSAEAEPNDFDPNDPAENTPEKRAGLRKAKQAETKKRQELERQIAELRNQLSVQQQRTVPQEQRKADPEDQFFENPAGFVDTRAKSHIDPIRQQVNQTLHQMSRRMMMKEHQDFAEAETAFVEAAKADPTLFVRLQAATSSGEILPAEFAYETGKQIMRLEKAGVTTLDELESHIRKQLLEELDAKQRKEGALTAAERASTSSVGARGSGASSQVASEEEPIGKILKRR